jgi:hypothetical protein
MGAPIIQQGNDQLSQLTNLFKVVSPEFGSGKTTESQQSSTNTTDADELLRQIYSSANPADIDNMIGNILNRAKQAFGPAAIGANAAGLRAYSDTSQQQLRDEAMARATGEAAQAKLAAINDAHKTAAAVVDQKMQNQRRVTSEKKTGMSPSGTGLLIALGASAIKNKVKGKGVEDAGENPDIFSKASGTGDEYGYANVANFPGDTEVAPAIDTVSMPSENEIDSSLSAVPTADEAIDATDLTSAIGDTEFDTAAADVGSSVVDDTGGSTILDDIFGDFFADGGVVPGTRPAPGAFAPGVANSAKNSRTSTAALATPASGVIKPPSNAARKSSTPLELEDATAEGATSAASTGPTGGTLGAFAPSSFGLAMAGLNALSGNLPGALATLTVSALVNSLANSTPDSEAEGPAAPASMFSSDFTGDAFEEGAGLAGLSGAPDTASQGDFAADSGMSGDYGLSGGDSSGGDSAGAGGDSGGDGGGGGNEADGGPIEARTAEDNEGLDKVIIHATPGEAILPVDTVQALGGMDAIEELIRKTHKPIRRAR